MKNEHEHERVFQKMLTMFLIYVQHFNSTSILEKVHQIWKKFMKLKKLYFSFFVRDFKMCSYFSENDQKLWKKITNLIKIHQIWKIIHRFCWKVQQFWKKFTGFQNKSTRIWAKIHRFWKTNCKIEKVFVHIFL